MAACLRRTARGWQLAACLLVGAIWMYCGANAQASPGDADGSFSADGLAFAPFGELADPPYYRASAGAFDATVARDGSITTLVDVRYGNDDCVPVSVQYCTPFTLGPALARFRADGSLDQSFGGNGQVEFGSPSDPAAETANAIAAQEDGKVLLAGRVGGTGMWVARLLQNGDLDPSFGQGGVVKPRFGGVQETANAIVVQPDGRIVLAGKSEQDYRARLLAVRLLPDGQLDPTYSGDGWRVDDIGEVEYRGLFDLERRPDGRLLGMAQLRSGYPFRFALVEYLPNGELNPAFGSDGVLVPGLRDAYRPAEMALDPAGRILITAEVNPLETGDTRHELVRLTEEGRVDPSFGNGGAVTITEPTGSFYAGPVPQMAVDATSRPYLASSDRGIRLLRLTEDGRSDESFAEGDWKTIFLRRGTAGAGQLVLTPDYAVVAGGGAKARKQAAMAARFELAAGPEDTDGDGVLDGADECAAVFGDCPNLGRRIKLRLDRGRSGVRLIGRVRSEFSECSAGVPVLVRLKKPGRDRVIARVRTAYTRFIAHDPPSRGRAYALVRKRRLAYGDCPRVRSRKVDLRHPSRS